MLFVLVKVIYLKGKWYNCEFEDINDEIYLGLASLK